MAKGVRNYMHPVFAIITTPEIVIVGALILVLFGAERLPKLARSMGQAKKEFEAAAHNWRGDSASQPPGGQAGPPQPPAPSQPSTPPNPPPPASQ